MHPINSRNQQEIYPKIKRHKYTDFWRYYDLDFSNKDHCNCLEFNKLGLIVTKHNNLIQIAIAIPFLIFLCITFDSKNDTKESKFGFAVSNSVSIYFNSRHFCFDVIDTLFGKEIYTIQKTTSYEILTHYNLGTHKSPLKIDVSKLICKRVRWFTKMQRQIFKITLVEPFVTNNGDFISELTYGATDLGSALSQLINYFEAIQ